ncbi:GNAT family N-acetyltransferase [Streptomyces sp. NPDC090056]|uniref:GNAT family N-acetyltransferase n=1 Tax=Streptomyces sp. NPDC090056 TaxID=3365934 RepID=UPI0037FA71E6
MSISRKPRALYLRIADQIRAEISDGTLAPGARLPTEAELAQRWDTTRSTATKGLGVLINEGLIVSDRPRGHFVRARRPMAYRPQAEFRRRPLSPAMDAFMAQLTGEGRSASQKIEVAIVQPAQEIRERLQLEEGQLTAVRRRVRFVDDEPYHTNDSYFPLDLVQGTEIMDPADIARGANAVLAELGYEQVRALDEVHIRMPSPEEADRLHLGPGTPVAIHVVTGFTGADKPVRVVVNCLPGDRHIITWERSKPRLSEPLSIRPAAENELGTITALWEQAAEWLNSRGIDQWQYAPREARIAAGIAAGECYLVEDGDVAVATITLDRFADSDFWTEEEAAQPALYVHRMVVRRDVSGGELGSAMLDWASEQAKAAGLKWLRLDAWRDNNALQEYYLGRGFEHVRTVEAEGRSSGALFQRAAGQVRRIGPELQTASASAAPVSTEAE